MEQTVCMTTTFTTPAHTLLKYIHTYIHISPQVLTPCSTFCRFALFSVTRPHDRAHYKHFSPNICTSSSYPCYNALSHQADRTTMSLLHVNREPVFISIVPSGPGAKAAALAVCFDQISWGWSILALITMSHEMASACSISLLCGVQRQFKATYRQTVMIIHSVPNGKSK